MINEFLLVPRKHFFIAVNISYSVADPELLTSEITLLKNISLWFFYPDRINNNTSSSFLTDAALVGNPHWLQWHRNRSLALGRDSQIVYNRVPKCGSRTIVDLLRYMGKKQNFTYKHSTTYIEFNLTHEAEERQVGKIFNMMKPTVFDRHMYFINFKK